MALYVSQLMEVGKGTIVVGVGVLLRMCESMHHSYYLLVNSPKPAKKLKETINTFLHVPVETVER
jgi:hypothetical protein